MLKNSTNIRRREINGHTVTNVSLQTNKLVLVSKFHPTLQTLHALGSIVLIMTLNVSIYGLEKKDLLLFQLNCLKNPHAPSQQK